MARTLRRQRARAARDAATSNTVKTYSADSSNDKLWTTLDEVLLGLLDVEIDDLAADSKHQCPTSVKVVMRLDLIRAMGAHDKVERRIPRVMDALGMLAVVEEVYRADPEAFWTRLMASDMMIEPWDSIRLRNVLYDIVAFSRVHSLRIILCWRERPFQSHAAHAIHAFLQSPRRKYEELLQRRRATYPEHVSSVRVGLRFAECQLSPSDLQLLMEALIVPTLTWESDLLDAPLCGVYTLLSLEFQDVKLNAAGLDAIAAGLAHPHARLVDGLSLEKVIQLTDAPDYIPAFKRVLEAAFEAKHVDTIGSCGGLKLSLAQNETIQEVHVKALQEALVVATRPLSRLDLTKIPGKDDGTWLCLGQIIFTPSRLRHDHDSELSISHLLRGGGVVDPLSISLANIVGGLLPRVQVALRDSLVVCCRVYDRSSALSTHATYQVVGARITDQGLSGSLLISTPSSSDTVTWVESSSINYLRIGEEDVVVGCRFTHLSVHCADFVWDRDEATLRLLKMCGHSLRHLLLSGFCNLHTHLPGILRASPKLRTLDLHCVYIHKQREITIWDCLSDHSLEIISLYSCFASAANITVLLSRLLHARYKTLRLLDLRGDIDFDEDTLDVLLQLLQTNRSLVRVEMPWKCLDTSSPSDVALQHGLEAIDAYLLAEWLPRSSHRLAFLSVLRRHEHLQLDGPMIQKVFCFTGASEKRVVRWNKQEDEERQATFGHDRA